MHNKIKIGVMGSAKRSKELPKELKEKAKIIGEEIAKNNCILVTGACMGVPHVAAKGCLGKNGVSLGYSPAANYQEHIMPPISYPKPLKNQILLYTGLGKIERNLRSIIDCDGVIIIGGGIGTLNEFSIAFHEGKVIGVLETKMNEAEGSVEKFLKNEGENSFSKKVKEATIIKGKDPRELVKKVIQKIEEKRKETQKEFPVIFRSKSGNNLMGIFHVPDVEKPPVVILAHGFQGNKMGTEKGRAFVKLSRKLKDQGFLVFRFDFEGCGDSEGLLEKITIKKEVENLKVAVEVVRKNVDIDENNIFLLGLSMGAVVTALTVEELNFKPNALVFWNQAFNQKKLFKNWFNKKDVEDIKENGWVQKGSKTIGREYFEENKNKDYTDKVPKNIPILLIHGKKDEDVPVESSQQISQNKENVNLKIIPRANHKFEEQEEVIVRKTVNWIKKFRKEQ